MNKIIYTITATLIALVLLVPATALAQPTNATRYVPMMLDTECFLYGRGCDQFDQDPSGLHYYDTQTGRIFKYKPVNDVPLCHDPYYMAGKLGPTCYDEGDDPGTNSSDGGSTGFIPMPGPEPEPERPVCTPDGPECPPCPEGVEAGWCADEDERQDTDDGFGEEESANCGGEPCTPTEKEDSWLEDKEESESEDDNEDSGSDGGNPVVPF